MLALKLSLELILLMAVGFFIWRKGMVDSSFDKSLTNLIMNIALPCLIINSFRIPFSQAELRNCVVLIVLSMILMAVWFLMGQLAYKIARG